MTEINREMLTVIALALSAVSFYILRHYTYFERLYRMIDLFCRHIYFVIALKNARFSVVDFYERHADKSPADLQLIMAETGEKRTRIQVDELANQVAHWIQSLHEENTQYKAGNDVVALMLTNCLDYVSIWMGISKMGVATSLINTNITGICCVSFISMYILMSRSMWVQHINRHHTSIHLHTYKNANYIH